MVCGRCQTPFIVFRACYRGSGPKRLDSFGASERANSKSPCTRHLHPPRVGCCAEPTTNKSSTARHSPLLSAGAVQQTTYLRYPGFIRVWWSWSSVRAPTARTGASLYADLRCGLFGGRTQLPIALPRLTQATGGLGALVFLGTTWAVGATPTPIHPPGHPRRRPSYHPFQLAAPARISPALNLTLDVGLTSNRNSTSPTASTFTISLPLSTPLDLTWAYRPGAHLHVPRGSFGQHILEKQNTL